MLSTPDLLAVLLALSSSLFLYLRSTTSSSQSMKIKQIFIYPVKSLPPISVKAAKIDARGFEFDRRFMLISPGAGDKGADKNHLISNSPKNTQIIPSLEGGDLVLTSATGELFRTALDPATDGLEEVEVDLHNSKVLAFDMGEEAARFFTEACGGVATRFIYIGAKGHRPVLGSMGEGGLEGRGIAFTDHGNFMVATTSSLDALSASLGREMDIVPLRPNIVLRPASRNHVLLPWAEDFWSELKIGQLVLIQLTANCVRCISLNINYKTGEFLTGNDLPLKVLAKDRRVDTGSYSPVFGRYGFSESIGEIVSVNDTVTVVKHNTKRTTFDWPY